MWTDENRQRYNRDKLRYPRGITDEEWSNLKALIPPGIDPPWRRKLGFRPFL
jgi:putative transposase